MATALSASPTTPTSSLPSLQAIYASTVLEDAIDQLAVLGGVMPQGNSKRTTAQVHSKSIDVHFYFTTQGVNLTAKRSRARAIRVNRQSLRALQVIVAVPAGKLVTDLLPSDVTIRVTSWNT